VAADGTEVRMGKIVAEGLFFGPSANISVAFFFSSFSFPRQGLQLIGE